MSSIQKLVHHWKQGQFIPGGKLPQPLNDEVKVQRLSELNGDVMIALEITKGISILKDAAEAFKITQEFNKDPTSFSGDARDVLMSDDFLLVADVLRLIFPEGMISEVWQLKRRRDDDLDTQDDYHAPGNRPMLIPKSRKRRLDSLGEQEESMNSANRPETQEPTAPLSSAPSAGYTGMFGAKSPAPGYKGIFSPHKGFASEQPSKPVVSGSSEMVSDTSPSRKYTGLFGAKSPTPEYKGIFSPHKGFASEQSTKPVEKASSPTLQYTGLFGAKSPTPEYKGIFSPHKGFSSEQSTKPVEKVSDTSPTLQYTGLFGAKSSKPQTGGIFGTTNPSPEHTGSSSQHAGSLSGNNKEATLDNLLSSMGGDDVDKILAQLQLHQQGIKRKHEEEKEIINKKQKNIQETPSLIEL